ncbi:hypothetical protein [Herbaspirillum sp. NPDC101397]|uniref:hypothetical protein n=1 Tax=Herbaspirillum sp. NPDC101397 TaxID=3364006 RepID=UPI00383BD56C
MAERFAVEQPKDTGDGRVAFIIKFNGTVLPGFIGKDTLVGIGGLTTNNLVALFTQHVAVIAAAVRKKLPAPLAPYIAVAPDDLK